MMFWKSEKVKILKTDLERIMDLASPRLGYSACQECGGKMDMRTSPVYCDHAPNCPGVARSLAIYAIIFDAAVR